jgi:CubicO group peptidase (beta-lactamase class C family)
VTAATVSLPADAQQPDGTASVDSVFAIYDNTRSPGCALGVIRDGEFLLRRGYGMADLEHGTPISSATVFRIGSTSKQFTAAAMVLLEQEGKLSLDDDIRLHMPEIPEYGEPVTIRQLYLTLMYLSGLRDDDFFTDDEVVAMLARQRELNFPPGDQYLYSNSGYFLLSQIVKRVADVSLREYAEQRIFGPLGMQNTHFHDDHTEIVPDRAMGYAPAEGDGFRISMTTLGMIGDGGVFTSVDDLLKWDNFFYDSTAAVPPVPRYSDFWQSMLTRGVLSDGDTLDYALGLSHGKYRGLRTIRHSGGFVGFRAQMVRFPDERFSVICLCNLSRSNPTRLVRAVADVYLADLMDPAEAASEGRGGSEDEGPTQPATKPETDLAAITGTYFSEELDTEYQITVDGDSLLLNVGNDMDGVLGASERDVLTRRDLRFRFQRDSGGSVTGFLLDAGRVRNLWFAKR